MQTFKFGGVTVLAVQLFNKIKKKKNLKKNMFRCISHMLCQNTIIFGKFVHFVCFLLLFFLLFFCLFFVINNNKFFYTTKYNKYNKTTKLISL